MNRFHVTSDSDDSDNEYVKPSIIPNNPVVSENFYQLLNYPEPDNHSISTIIDMCNEIVFIHKKLQEY